MTYKINSTRVLDDTLWTDVTYTIDGKEVNVEVAHFQPQDKNEVIRNIENRELSEQAKQSAKLRNEQIIKEL